MNSSRRVPGWVGPWLLACLVWSCQAADGGSESAADVDAGFRILVSPLDFRRYPAAEDPLASHQPAVIDCGVAGAYVERDQIEIDTGYCTYVLLKAPAAVAVPEGERVMFQLHHFDLAAPEPAEGHGAILFGDTVQWQTTVEIPHPAQVLDVTFTATRALQVGDPIRLHLHNHGQNTWAISALRVE